MLRAVAARRVSEMDREKTGVGGILALLVTGAIFVMGQTQDHVASPAETQEIIGRLGYEWQEPGPPVVLFSNPG